MIKTRRTKYQWVDSKWVQLIHELREVHEKFVVYIYFRYVSMSATMIEAILNPNTEERPVETGRKRRVHGQHDWVKKFCQKILENGIG